MALTEFRRNVTGWMFQAAGLLPMLTAEENVALALRIQGRSLADAGRAARAALEVVGLQERATAAMSCLAASNCESLWQGP